MAGTIKMTPEELRTTADDLKGRKGEIFDTMTAMDGKIQALDWQGTSQQRFLDMWQETYNGVHKMLDESVDGIAKALQGAADTLTQVDENLLK